MLLLLILLGSCTAPEEHHEPPPQSDGSFCALIDSTTSVRERFDVTFTEVVLATSDADRHVVPELLLFAQTSREHDLGDYGLTIRHLVAVAVAEARRADGEDVEVPRPGPAVVENARRLDADLAGGACA